VILTDKRLALRFDGDRLGLSARRVWEHVELRQINPFRKSPFDREIRVDEFIDIVDMPGSSNTLTGATLADLRGGDFAGLPRPQVESLLQHTHRQAGRRWLRSVENFLISVGKRRAVRNIPTEFLPRDIKNPLGIAGLHLSLVTWLEKNADDKAPIEQWARRIKNLQKNGFRADEWKHCGFSEFAEHSEPEILNGHQVANSLTYDGLRLSVLPYLHQAGCHTRFVSVQRDVALKRIKPKLKQQVRSNPQFLDKTLGYWIDVLDWNDLLGEQRGWIALTYRGNPITSPNNPSGLCRSPEDAMKLADAHASQIMPRMSIKGKWSDDRLSGGQNYREWLITLPEFRPSYFSPHFDCRNILFHVRCDVREDQLGNRVLFLEEVQSDWAKVARQSLKERDIWPNKVPEPPWLQEWPSLAIKLMLLHAARNNLDGLAWTPGSVHVNRWGERASLRLYDCTLPKALNQALRPYENRCKSIDVFLPVNFHIEPGDSGYVVTDADDNVLGTADTWEGVQELLPDGAHEKLKTMHGVRLGNSLRKSILENGIPAWGNGIK
jgi:hypothetical protein